MIILSVQQLNSVVIVSGSSAVTRTYSYDGMDRLTGMTSTDGYNTVYTYNLNSGPSTIKRYGKKSTGSMGLIDDLSVRYTGNRPLIIGEYADKVIYENASDLPETARYKYDSQGRMTEDSSRDITTITYNHLDRPGSIDFGDGASVTYTYSATGQKLSSTYSRNLPTGERSETRYYCGGAEFVKNGTTAPTFSRCNMGWGYIDPKNTVNLYTRDYQGNIRGVMSSTGAVRQTTDYYPYGTPMQSSTGAEVNRYKYGGKEFETERGLNHYDFEARTLIPQTCLFSTPDPKAGDYPGLNPYLYCAANPLKYIDPTGKYFIGTDNKPVTYRDGKWSDNTPPDTKRYASYLEKSPTGKGLFKVILNSKVKTSVKFSKEERNDKKYGYTSYIKIIGNVTKKVLSETADIIIYEENIRKNAPKYREQGVTSHDEKAKAIIDAQLSDEEFIESTCVHEGVHATDPENLSNSKEDKQARENRAVDKQKKSINEIVKRRTKINDIEYEEIM